GRSSRGTAGAPIPALLKSTSSRPKVDFSVANSERIDSRLDTSVGTANDCAPAALISPATLSSISLRRPASRRLYPALASAIDPARPTPVPAPVTSAIFADAAIGDPFRTHFSGMSAYHKSPRPPSAAEQRR